MPTPRFASAVAGFVLVATAFSCTPAASAEAPAPSALPAAQVSSTDAAKLARVRFRTETIVDSYHGGVIAVRYVVPQDWRAAGNVAWTYSDVSMPVRLHARAEAPDGSAWIEAYPSELFYWMQPILMPTQPGTKSLGMIYQPDIGAIEAMQRFIVLRYRGNVQNLQFVGWRPVPNLAQALGKPAKPGDSIAIRIRYQRGDEIFDEEFYGLLGTMNRVPYTGPQGTTYEFHRMLSYVISMGAKAGRLESSFALLGFVASSFQVDPAWERLAQQVNQQIQMQFNQYIARGYAQIQAAAQLSRTISANNDAWLAAQREQSATRAASEDRLHDNFLQYLRGTERVVDPGRGTSEQPSQYRYHWTDAFGSVRHSDDPNYDPNLGSTTTWRKMEPVR